MKIKTIAMAGTLESSDISIIIEPSSKEGIDIELKSLVEKQYGEHIRNVVLQTLQQMNVTSAVVKLNDKGALDCVIKARLQTAVLRSAEVKTFSWREEN